MLTVDQRPIQFGELTGSLVHGSTFFDWAAVSVQAFADALDDSLTDIVRSGDIPYAPVGVSARIDRYPGLGDAVSVNATPTGVGEHRIDIAHEFVMNGRERVGAMEIAHVTVGTDGTARRLPDPVRERVSELLDPDRSVESGGKPSLAASDADAVSRTFTVRGPHTEAVALAYFEEYPRFAAVALEEYLEAQGATVDPTNDPFLRLQSWEWSFEASVPLGAELEVRTGVSAATPNELQVDHEFVVGGEPAVRGTTSYACYTAAGERTSFTSAVRAGLDVGPE